MISSPARCAAPTVVLSCPRRRDGAPAVPARWLTRLEMLLAGQGTGAAAASGRRLGARAGPAGGGPRPVRPPRPCPPVALRPRRLSGDRDRDLAARSLRDPRAPRAEAERAASRWTRRRMPRTTAAWCMPGCTISWRSTARAGRPTRADAAAAGDGAGAGGGRICARRWPRGGRRGWSGSPTGSREHGGGAAQRASARWRSSTEASGALELARPGGLFRLTGRADRIERRRDGGLAILDYKTGTPPSQKEVDAGLAPQLLLEAAMAAAGAFGDGICRGGGGADLLAPDRRLPPRRAADAVQGEPGGDRRGGRAMRATALCALIDAYRRAGRAAICRSRSPAARRGSPTMRSSPGWPNGRRRGTRDE